MANIFNMNRFDLYSWWITHSLWRILFFQTVLRNWSFFPCISLRFVFSWIEIIVFKRKLYKRLLAFIRCFLLCLHFNNYLACVWVSHMGAACQWVILAAQIERRFRCSLKKVRKKRGPTNDKTQFKTVWHQRSVSKGLWISPLYFHSLA